MTNHRILWITGLSSAGKTTVASLVTRKLQQAGVPALLLDGDEIRKVVPVPLGHSVQDRELMGKTYVRLAKVVSSQGIVAVVSTISLLDSITQYRRRLLGQWCTDIFLDAPEHVRVDRDRRMGRNIYQHDAPRVIGRGQKAQLPHGDLIVLSNDGTRTPDEVADDLIATVF